MTNAPAAGPAVDPAQHDHESSLGKWDRWYKFLQVTGRPATYGDPTTYYMAASFLADCAVVEDWGCGVGGFSSFCKGDYVGVDASRTPFASRIADLATYRSDVDGILLRHVLEHNYNWPRILKAATTSFRNKLCVILFTPFADTTRELAHNRSRGVDAPDLALSTADIEACLGGLQWVLFRDMATKSQYGVEHVYCVWRRETQEQGLSTHPAAT